MKSISSASKLRQWRFWRTKICAAKIQKFSRISEKPAASAKDLKNPRRRIVLVNDLLQIGFSLPLSSSSINASSFDLNNYNHFRGRQFFSVLALSRLCLSAGQDFDARPAYVNG